LCVKKNIQKSSSLKVLVSNDEIPAEIQKEISKIFPNITLKQGYAPADLSPIISYGTEHSGIPLPQTEIKFDSDKIIWIKGPQVPKDYLHNLRKIPSRSTDNNPIPMGFQGYFRTMDKGEFDKKGILHVFRHIPTES